MRRRRHLLSAGLPRASAPWDGRRRGRGDAGLPPRLPVPWINAPSVKEDGDWHAFRDGALEVAHARGCVICGRIVPDDEPLYLAAYGGRRETSGMGGHAPCILLAAMRCPHLVEVHQRDPEATVAWRYDGPGPGCTLPAIDRADEGWGGGEAVDDSAKSLDLAALRAEAQLART